MSYLSETSAAPVLRTPADEWPRVAEWLHSLTSIDVLAIVAAAVLIIYLTLGRPR